MGGRASVGDEISVDGSVQWITDRPAAVGGDTDGETVAATPSDDGEITAENVPDLSPEQPERSGQTRIDDWSDRR